MPVTILAVEDNPADQQIMLRAFAKIPHEIRFERLTDGEQALRYLFRTCEFADPETSPRPDAILLDINLPRLTGIEVLRRVKSQPELAGIPAIIVSSSSYERDMQRCAQYGCALIVQKSIDLNAYREHLLRAVRTCVPALA